MSSVQTPQQNGVVERRNLTLVEAARTMLIFSRAPLFLWAEAIATVCFTQNRSIIHRRFKKTPYELINGRTPDMLFLHVFGALCYPKNDHEDIRKLGAKAYKDMQQKIKRLQAQLGDLKGKSKDTSCVSHTRNPLSQKLENENVEIEFPVLKYARENAHFKATYKNLFYSISVSRTLTKTIIASLQNELQSTIYKNAKIRTQLFKKVSDQKDNTHDKSENTKFAKQPMVENLPKIGKTNALSKSVTSNSVSTPQELKGMNNDKVIAPGMFRINPLKTSREEKHVPNIVSASTRKKLITVSQPPVITKKNVNSDLNGLSSTGVDN
nr:retrovirus-related Pol polyprotein from transposon TNT 1-94 [Tanacetum cinerariifolium]